jgi:hypothetical protein
MSTPLALALALTFAAQPLPPELRVKERPTYDPVLPDALRPVVEQASAAELDPKRGAGNAVALLRAERAKHTGAPQALQAIDVRVAATLLRQGFLGQQRGTPAEKAVLALSTFSKLEAREPGFAAWLDRAIAAQPEAFRAPRDTKAERVMTLEVVAQGPGLARDRAESKLQSLLDGVGFTARRPKQLGASDYVARVAATEVREKDGRAIVRLTLDLTAQEAGKVVWSRSSFRTVEAASAREAVAEAEDWLLRIGARDLVFHWLEAAGLQGAVMRPLPGTGGEHGHDHDHEHARPAPRSDAPASKVTIPRNEGRERR